MISLHYGKHSKNCTSRLTGRGKQTLTRKGKLSRNLTGWIQTHLVSDTLLLKTGILHWDRISDSIFAIFVTVWMKCLKHWIRFLAESQTCLTKWIKVRSSRRIHSVVERKNSNANCPKRPSQNDFGGGVRPNGTTGNEPDTRCLVHRPK